MYPCHDNCSGGYLCKNGINNKNNIMENTKAKMAFSSLLGLILPLGAIWGPLLFRTEESGERVFRKNYVIIQVCASIILIVLGVMPWIEYMSRLTHGVNSFDGIALFNMLLYPIGILCISLGTGFYQLSRK